MLLLKVRHIDRYLKNSFWKVLFLWSSMLIFSFLGYTLTELFRKPDKSRQLYKQTIRLFIHQTMCREGKFISTSWLQNSCLITFLKKYRSSHLSCRSSHQSSFTKERVVKSFGNFTEKHLCWRCSMKKVFLVVDRAVKVKCFYIDQHIL